MWGSRETKRQTEKINIHLTYREKPGYTTPKKRGEVL
jgi:hypothetical protein